MLNLDLGTLTILFLVAVNLALLPRSTAYNGVNACPDREVSSIRKQSEYFELSLLFYYVSWCRESRAAKNVYDELAHHYQGQAQFATVDCWHLACNCSGIYATAKTGIRAPMKWPSLSVHFGRHISLYYNGEWKLKALIQFMNNLLRPIDRLHSKEELRAFSMQSDAVILGIFPNASTIEYRKFAVAAVKSLEVDPERCFRFVVTFGYVALDLITGIEVKMPLIMLINGKGMEVFNTSEKWFASNIVRWAQSELKQVFNLLNCYSSPSAIAFKLRVGPVLTIYENNMDFKHNFYTIMSKETGFLDSLNAQFAICEALSHSIQKTASYTLQMQDRKSHKLEQSRLCYMKNYFTIHNLQNYYYVNYYLNHIFNKFGPTRQQGAEASSTDLLELYQRRNCLKHPDYKTPDVQIAVAKSVKKAVDKLWLDSSILTRSNRTLSVLILNGAKHINFLDAHGIENLNSGAAVAFIADSKQESVFVMQNQFSYNALLAFINDYYSNNILLPYKVASYFESRLSALNSFNLQSMNRLMFSSVIERQNATTVVLLYSPECAFSGVMSHTLMQISVMLNADDFKFIRLNTRSNDLPWELVMPSSPTLLLFPRGRFTESVVFPAHLKLNVHNMFGFILAQLEPVDQVKAVLTSCQRKLSAERRRKCLQYGKTLVLNNISDQLKYWQVFENERSLVLDRLKQLKYMSLEIQRSFILQ